MCVAVLSGVSGCLEGPGSSLRNQGFGWFEPCSTTIVSDTVKIEDKLPHLNILLRPRPLQPPDGVEVGE